MTAPMNDTFTDTATGRNAQQDFARVDIDTPWPAAWLRTFFHDPERLLRLNPFLTIRKIHRTAPDTWEVQGRNDATERDFHITMRRQPLPDGNGYRLLWDGWLKNETRLIIKDSGAGAARIAIIDDYSATPLPERERRKDEVDISIIPWGQYIHAYLHWLHKFGWLPGYMCLMTGPWLRMTPSARRISKWLIFITIAEFIFFLMVFSIFWLEYRN